MPVQENLFLSDYHKAVTESMTKLGCLKNTLFVGQQTVYQDFYGTLKGIPLNKRIELPVTEEMQMGFCIGLALEGFLPICIYQRIDFMYRAMDSLCNHLSLLPELSHGRFTPKVIVRTTIGSDDPLDPGIQHTQDLTEVFQKALRFSVVKVTTPEEVIEIYQRAINKDEPIMIIEEQKRYYSLNGI